MLFTLPIEESDRQSANDRECCEEEVERMLRARIVCKARRKIAGTYIADVLTRIPPAHLRSEVAHFRGLAEIDSLAAGACGLAGREKIFDQASRGGLRVGHPYRQRVFRGSFRPLEPGLVPKDQAARLASTVRRSIAAQPFEVHRVFHPANAPGCDVVAGFVRALENAESPPAVLHHLGHEGQTVQAAATVKGGENFALAANFDPVAGFQIQRLGQGGSFHPSRGSFAETVA